MDTENKTIIYLDQNFISDIAKLSLEDKKNKVKPLLKTLFKAIKKGVDEEKFLAPDSWIHAIETAAESSPDLQSSIHNYQGYLGQVSLNPPWDIKNSQFIEALLDYFSKTPDEKEMWRTAFQENPDKRMENFKINVRLPEIGMGGLDLDQHSVTALQKIRESGVQAKDQYKAEMDATRQHYKSLLPTDFSYVLRKHEISMDQAKKFIDSHQFTEIPSIDIFCRLWSKNLANKDRKEDQLSHDFNDIQFLSIYMPYCSAIGTDKYMKELSQSLKFDTKYCCKLFTMKDTELTTFISYLDQERKIKKPANKSLFSVVCTMVKQKPTYPVSFLKKLTLARNKFQNTGKYWNKKVYIDIFLVYPSTKSEIKMPSSDEIQKDGPQAFNSDQWSEFLIFGSNLKKIYNPKEKSIKDLVKGIPDHLKGAATAILSDDSNFDEDRNKYDSYLFYDIENAIGKKLDSTERYNVRIIYP